MCVSIREIEGVISIEHPLCNASLFDSDLDQWAQEEIVAWTTTVSQEIAMLDVEIKYRSGTDEAEALIGEGTHRDLRTGDIGRGLVLLRGRHEGAPLRQNTDRTCLRPHADNGIGLAAGGPSSSQSRPS